MGRRPIADVDSARPLPRALRGRGITQVVFVGVDILMSRDWRLV